MDCHPRAIPIWAWEAYSTSTIESQSATLSLDTPRSQKEDRYDDNSEPLLTNMGQLLRTGHEGTETDCLFLRQHIRHEETELDLDGTVTLPAKGDTRQHGGKTWRVEHVTTDRTAPTRFLSTAFI